ncbi:MAG: NusA-like transcription termination signal-binding factor [Nanoarchaeota archaeon]
MKKLYNSELMKYITLIENVGKVSIKDLFLYNGTICCTVDKNKVSILIGAEGKKIKRIQNMFNKKIKVIGYSEDIKEFVKDFIYPIKIDEIEQKDKNLILRCSDRKTKGLLIGRGKTGLNNLHDVVSRYFKIDNISIE